MSPNTIRISSPYNISFYKTNSILICIALTKTTITQSRDFREFIPFLTAHCFEGNLTYTKKGNIINSYINIFKCLSTSQKNIFLCSRKIDKNNFSMIVLVLSFELTKKGLRLLKCCISFIVVCYLCFYFTWNSFWYIFIWNDVSFNRQVWLIFLRMQSFNFMFQNLISCFDGSKFNLNFFGNTTVLYWYKVNIILPFQRSLYQFVRRHSNFDSYP